MYIYIYIYIDMPDEERKPGRSEPRRRTPAVELRASCISVFQQIILINIFPETSNN